MPEDAQKRVPPRSLDPRRLNACGRRAGTAGPLIKHFVSITPLHLDLTDEKDLARVLARPISPVQPVRRSKVPEIKKKV